MERLFAKGRLYLRTLALAAVLVVSTNVSATPAAVLVDLESGQRVLEEQAALRIETEAATGLMTLYTALTMIEEAKLPLETPLRDQAASAEAKTSSPKNCKTVEASKENALIADALLAMAVGADQTATSALIRTIASSEDVFTARMNDLAHALGLTDTHFVSPYSGQKKGETATKEEQTANSPTATASAADIAVLAQRLCLDFPQVKIWTSERQAQFEERTIENTNVFLGNTVTGLSVTVTDNTLNAVLLAETPKRNGRVRRLLAVVLDARNNADLRERISTILLRGWRDYESIMIYPAGTVVGEFPVYRGNSDSIAARVETNVIVTLPKERMLELGNRAVNISVKRWSPIIAPVKEGASLGSLVLSAEGETLKEVPIVAATDVRKGNFLQRLTDNITLAFHHQESVDHGALPPTTTAALPHREESPTSDTSDVLEEEIELDPADVTENAEDDTSETVVEGGTETPSEPITNNALRQKTQEEHHD